MEEIGQQGRELEKLQGDLSDIARLNRELASGNLSADDAQSAWGNVNRKLSEVKQVQESRKSRLYSRSDEFDDKGKGEKLGKVVEQKEAEVMKQTLSQSTLTLSNGTFVAQPPVNKPTGGNGPAPQQGQQLKGNITLGDNGSLKTWNYNKDAQQQGTQTFATKTGSGKWAENGGTLDLNDNVTVANNFFQSRETDSDNRSVHATAGCANRSSVGDRLCSRWS